MHKLGTRFTVALLTFLLGVGAVALWYFHYPFISRDVRLVVPHANWEPIFFRAINPVARLSGQADLRKTSVAEGDIEVRVWWGFGLSPLEGITLCRNNGEWSAIHVKADNYHEPTKAERKDLGPPKSGWEAVWQHLTNTGILTLADANEVNCSVDGLDGMAFVVETNANYTYRTYKYGNPMYAKCTEAKQIMEIGDTLYREFGLEEPGKRR